MDIIGLRAVLGDEAFQSGVANYQKGIAQMERATDSGASIMSNMWAVGGAAVAVGAAAVVAGIGAIVAVSKTGLDALTSWNDEVNGLVDTLGVSGEQGSAWATAFAHVGLTAQEGGAGLNFFVKNLDDLKKVVPGAKTVLTPFQLALKSLGVSAFDARGKLRTFDELMPDLLDSFQKMPAGVQKSALAMDLFGARAGTKFLDFLSQGSAGLEKAREMAKLYGLELDTDLSNAVEDFGFAMNDLNLGVKGFWVTIGKSVLPVAVKFVGFINDKLIPPLIQFGKFIAPLIANVAEALLFVFEDLFDLFTGQSSAIDNFSADLASLANIFGLDGRVIEGFTRDVLNNLNSVWNIFKLLATGDFTGGIFGLTEDSLPIGTLLIARDAVIGLFDAISKGDWKRAWGIITDSVGEFIDIFTDQLGDPGTVFKEWGLHLWDWLVDAGKQAGGKINEFVGSLAKFVQDNGPAAWTALQKWSTDFWAWLQVAGAQASSKIFEIAVSIATWLGNEWTKTIQPALELWGGRFFDWLTNPTTGVIATISTKFGDVTAEIVRWAQDPETQAQLERAGFEIGNVIIGGTGEELAKDEHGTSLITALAENLGRAIANGEQILRSVAIGFSKGIINALAKEWGLSETGTQLAQAIGQGMENAVISYVASGGPAGVALKLVRALVDNFKTMWTAVDWSDFSVPPVLDNLSRLLPPPAPVTAPEGSFNRFATQQSVGLGTSGGIGSLQVMVAIDGTELKNFSTTAAYNATTELFGSAMAAAGGAQ